MVFETKTFKCRAERKTIRPQKVSCSRADLRGKRPKRIWNHLILGAKGIPAINNYYFRSLGEIQQHWYNLHNELSIKNDSTKRNTILYWTVFKSFWKFENNIFLNFLILGAARFQHKILVFFFFCFYRVVKTHWDTQSGQDHIFLTLVKNFRDFSVNIFFYRLPTTFYEKSCTHET